VQNLRNSQEHMNDFTHRISGGFVSYHDLNMSINIQNAGWIKLESETLKCKPVNIGTLL